MSYTYEELIEDLEMGMEIEFGYKLDRYAISWSDRGWHLAKYGEVETQTFKGYKELLQNGKIDLKSIREIWPYIRP